MIRVDETSKPLLSTPTPKTLQSNVQASNTPPTTVWSGVSTPAPLGFRARFRIESAEFQISGFRVQGSVSRGASEPGASLLRTRVGMSAERQSENQSES